MSLVPYRTRSLSDEFDRFFSDFLPGASNVSSRNLQTAWAPAVNIHETDSEFVLEAEVPGIKPEEIDVSVEDGMISIQGERKAEEESEGKNYKRVERHYGSFQRSFRLPDNVNVDEIKAKSNNGILEITLPKVPVEARRKISIN